jgi:capsular polysaccharide biosynthesis protein
VPTGLTEALSELRDRWWVLVAAAVLAGAAAYVYTRLPWVEPRYRSSILIQATGRLDYGNTLALEKELRPLAEQVRQRSIMRQADDNLHADLPVDQILDHTRAEPVQDSSQIQVDVDDSDPGRAQSLALEIANVYVAQHNADEQSHVQEERVILFPLDRPNPAIQTWPQRKVIVPAAALLGLLLAAGCLIGARLLDNTLRYPEQIEAELGLPVLAAIPATSGHGRRPTIGAPRPRPPSSPAGPPPLEPAASRTSSQ